MITGGTVTYGRTVQPAQYESKKAEVTIHFAVEDGASEEAVQAIIDKASDMARGKASELVGLNTEAKPATASRASKASTAKDKTEPTQAEKDAQKAAAAAKMAEADKNKGKTKDKPADAGKGEELPDDPKPEISKNPENRQDPAQGSDLDADDELFADGGSKDAAKEYTDKDLTDVVTRVNGIIKDPAKIKAVRAKYTTGAIATIGKDKRAKFVAEIEALVPAK